MQSHFGHRFALWPSLSGWPDERITQSMSETYADPSSLVGALIPSGSGHCTPSALLEDV